MRKLIILAISGILICALPVVAKPDASASSERLAEAGVVGGAVLSQALGRADLAIAAGRVDTRHLKGAFGEHLTARYLNRGAEWVQVRQTIGRQGIDHLHLKVTPTGQITDLLVSEVKTGSSQLNHTSSGKQLSKEWTSKRLKTLASRYRNVVQSWSEGRVKIARPASVLDRKQVLEVPLGNRKSARFWRESSGSPWKLDAATAQLGVVEKQAGRVAQWLESAAEGRISYGSRLFEVKIEGARILTTVKDASGVSKGVSASKLPIIGRVVTPLQGGGSMSQALTSAWANELKRTQPHLSNNEISEQARALARETAASGLSFERPRMRDRFRKSTAVGVLLASGIDIGIQLWTTGEVDPEQVAVNAFAGGTGVGSGYITGFATTRTLMNTRIGLNLSRQVASSMGLASTSLSANLLGSAAGGTVAGVTFSYVLYITGYADLETANRMAIAGAAGSLAGVAVTATTTSLVAAFGTAGTGTAISSLSGAAATSATMAAIGGGSMAVGYALLWTGAGAVVVVVGAGVMWGFTMYDAAQENERLELTYEYLMQHYSATAGTPTP